VVLSCVEMFLVHGGDLVYEGFELLEAVWVLEVDGCCSLLVFFDFVVLVDLDCYYHSVVVDVYVGEVGDGYSVSFSF